MGRKPKERGRGRPPQGEYAGKAATFSTRITPGLRAALDRAAKRNGRSLSQEVERRLENSFDKKLQRDRREELADSFGGTEGLGLVLLLGELVNQVTVGGAYRWSRDPSTYLQLVKGIDAVLAALAPDEEAAASGASDSPAASQGEAAARWVLNQVWLRRDEPPYDLQADSQWFTKGENERGYPYIGWCLGDVVQRLSPFHRVERQKERKS